MIGSILLALKAFIKAKKAILKADMAVWMRRRPNSGLDHKSKVVDHGHISGDGSGQI